MKNQVVAARVGVEGLERRMMFAAAIDGWTVLGSVPKARGLKSDLNLASYQPLTLNGDTIANSLSKAPKENIKIGFGRGVNSRLINIPTPDGKYQRFRIVESTIMTGADQKKYGKAIRTFAGVGVDDPSASIRLDYTPQGFHAQVLTSRGGGAYYVEPYFKGSKSLYASYYARNSRQVAVDEHDDVTQTLAGATLKSPTAGRTSAGVSGTAVSLRTYRAAVAATAEYTAYFGGTVAAGQAAIVTAMNRVSGIYETELGIRLTLVGNNSSLVFTNTSTDGYTNNDPGALLSQNQSKVDTIIGNANYDIGHVFSTAGGGLAGLGVVGASGSKAQGETGTSAPVGDAFYVDYVAHEMGHQFGANHTFNTSQDPNRNFFTAVEPGSGSTIMAYAGLEGSDDIQANSDPYFSYISIDEILTYADTGDFSFDSGGTKVTYTRSNVPSVGTRTATGNNIPTVTLTNTSYTIPTNTPFTLTSPTATDANGDTVYYSWEEADSGAGKLLNEADNGSGALFRVYNPTTSPSRSFPRLQSVLAGQTYTQARYSGNYAERLPTTNRTMKFVLTLRDKKANGGGTNVLSSTPVNVTSVAAASGFGIINFNSAQTFTGGSTQTLNWNVAGTTANGINTANVQIAYSTDGGNNFTTLIASTANDGSEAITLPNVSSNQFRLRVSAVGNIFYDINNANLTVNAVSTPSTTPGVPDLLAATDSGVSNTDNLTRFNNSSGPFALQFGVSGTVSGATVTILADGVAIGSAVASGTTTTVTTNGTSTLANGVRNITATQTETGKTVSAASSALGITIDSIAPTVTGTPTFSYLNGGPQVTFTSSEPIGGLTLPQFFSATNTTTNSSVATANLVRSFSGSTVTLSFNGVSGAPSATTLPNGNYTATASAGAFSDLAGNVLAASSTATFYWLNGDANRDRTTDFNDFLVLQNHFNQPGTFADGDFDYNGLVDFNDFLVLQNNFGVTV